MVLTSESKKKLPGNLSYAPRGVKVFAREALEKLTPKELKRLARVELVKFLRKYKGPLRKRVSLKSYTKPDIVYLLSLGLSEVKWATLEKKYNPKDWNIPKKSSSTNKSSSTKK